MDERASESTDSPQKTKPQLSENGGCSIARARYEQKLSEIAETADRLGRLNSQLNIVRGLLFFAGMILLVVGYFAGEGTLLLVVPGWIAMAAFMVIITWHESIREQLDASRRRKLLYRQLIARLDRDWAKLSIFEQPTDQPWLGPNEQAVALDLDLFGHGSLYQLISIAGTETGKLTIAKWLCESAVDEIAEARNKAVLALKSFREQREEFYAAARDVAEFTASPENFARWASDPMWLTGRRAFLLPLARVLAIAPFVIWPSFGFGVISGEVAVIIQVVCILVATLITVGFLGPIHEIFKSVASRRAEVEHYVSLFESARWLPEDVPLLRPIRERALCTEKGAIAGLGAMGKLSVMTSLRHTPIWFIPYLLLQLTGLWDVHVLAKLEKWKLRYGTHVEDWFAALGQLEALLSLAALADEYPDWTSPAWVPTDTSARLQADGLGHPLLDDEQRVCNDVGVGPAGTLLLVTGSNMSGKSTLLRSLGLNVKLAGMGSVVCANSLKLPSCEVATSIRVHDSLREGVSFYMAELKRLRDVVEQAQDLQSKNDRVALYLLDEILQGTNSRERHIAVATVLDRLVEMNAIGAISTHDLELADDPDLQKIAQVVHFREQIVRDSQGVETMVFDYKMRSGVTPTTNAIRLLEMVGLGKPNDKS